MKLSCVRLMVTRFDDCFRFYRDTLGLKVTWGNLGDDYASFSLGGTTYLSIFRRELMARDVRTQGLPSSAVSQDAFAVVFQVDDLDALHDRLIGAGVEIVNPPIDYPDYGIRAMHLRDPEGGLIEINSQLSLDKWSEELRTEGKKYGWS